MGYSGSICGKKLESSARSREERVLSLTDQHLLLAHQGLKASRLLQDDLWLPLLEQELAGRNIARSA